MGAENADDSLQNLFLKIVRRGRLEEVDEPEKYLTRVQSSVFTNHWRRRSRVEVPVEDAEREDVDTTAVGERLERIEDVEFVRRCLPLLKARHRAVLELQMSGMGREAIAEKLGLSPHAVTQLTRRALDALDYKLKQNGYLRGLVPIPLFGWLRDKVRACADIMGRYARTLEGLVPLTVVAVASIVPPNLSDDGRIVSKDPVPVVSADRSADASGEARNAIRLGSSETGDPRRAAEERTRSFYVEQGGTQIWVDEWDKEEEEPTLDEQVLNLVNDPGRAFPSCPTNAPCPWHDM